jgi:broad specificity phosphatase PhoE
MAKPFIVRYLSHPQVLIEPTRPVDLWSLNALGQSRVAALCQAIQSGRSLLCQTRRVICSAETKALETATPIAAALGASLEVRRRMHENDRSATGYLPAAEFEAMADAFFAHPNQSQHGWETASAAQIRILDETRACLLEQDNADAGAGFNQSAGADAGEDGDRTAGADVDRSAGAAAGDLTGTAAELAGADAGGDANASARDVLIVGHGAVGTLLYTALARLPISRAHDQPAGGGHFWAFERPGNRVSCGWTPMEGL